MEVVAYTEKQSTNRDVLTLTENPNRLYKAGIYSRLHTNPHIQNATQIQSILIRPFACTFQATSLRLINV